MPKSLLYIQLKLTSMIISINVLHNKHDKILRICKQKLFKRVRFLYLQSPNVSKLDHIKIILKYIYNIISQPTHNYLIKNTNLFF